MQNNRYLNQDTLTVSFEESKKGDFVRIPAGTVVSVYDRHDEKMVEVAWDGGKVLMFSEDLEQRSHPTPEWVNVRRPQTGSRSVLCSTV